MNTNQNMQFIEFVPRDEVQRGTWFAFRESVGISVCCEKGGTLHGQYNHMDPKLVSKNRVFNGYAVVDMDFATQKRRARFYAFIDMAFPDVALTQVNDPQSGSSMNGWPAVWADSHIIVHNMSMKRINVPDFPNPSGRPMHGTLRKMNGRLTFEVNRTRPFQD